MAEGDAAKRKKRSRRLDESGATLDTRSADKKTKKRRKLGGKVKKKAVAEASKKASRKARRRDDERAARKRRKKLGKLLKIGAAEPGATQGTDSAKQVEKQNAEKVAHRSSKHVEGKTMSDSNEGTAQPDQGAQAGQAVPAASAATGATSGHATEAAATNQSSAQSIANTPAANATFKAPGAQGIALNAALGVDRQSFADTWRDLLGAAAAQPRALFDTALELQSDMLSIVFGNSALEPDPRDARFADEAWTHNPIYRRVGQAYLAWAKSLDTWLDRSGMTGMDRARARFVFDAAKEVFAPVNLLPTNPGALRQARDTRGQSVLSGIRNFIDDVRHNHGYPAAADRDGFVIGRDVAASPGAVVFRNELFELMQYQPNTEQVAAEPFLYVFSQVNRFYLGDLTPDRSMFQRLLDAGIPVFAVSWRNPTAEQRDWNLGTYAEGVIEAISVMREITGARKVNLMGLCAGGINAAMAAALLAGRGDDWVNSLSLFVNVLDNRAEDSDFGLFVSERSVSAQKERVRMKGVYDEKDVYEMFAMLRWEDNIMSFLRRNYLMGEAPLKHPLLFWSIDYTRVPAGLHSDFLDLSLDNRLAKNEFMALGKRVKLSDIRCPVYLMAGSTDHITPWRACYRSTQLFGGPVKFVLTNQNHTQTISARTDNKHLKYWIADQLPIEADRWAEQASEYPGSWMFDWIDWLNAQSPDKAPAPAVLGSDNYPIIDAAPGRYVLE